MRTHLNNSKVDFKCSTSYSKSTTALNPKDIYNVNGCINYNMLKTNCQNKG